MMYIGNNFKVLTKSFNSTTYHEEFFIDEKSARTYANEAYMTGAVIVELWHRKKDGYYLVKQVKEHYKVAESKYKAHVASLAEKAGCTIIFN